MIKTLLVICFLAMACVCGCSAILAKTSQLSSSRSTAGPRPSRGLFVTEVFPNSAATAAGIKTMDVLTRYGEYQIVDEAGYFAARNHYEESLMPSVEIVVWRGVLRTITVPTGRLGMNTRDIDKVSEAFSALMNHIKAMDEIPRYMHDVEFKGQFEEGPEKIIEKAKALIDQAELEETLTPAQVQVARIYMILDEAPEADQRQQAELLAQFFGTQPVNYIVTLGQTKFFDNKRYRAAIACFNHYLNTSPDDVSIRLNLAIAYNQLGMYDEADAAVDYVFDHDLKLSDYGHFVAYQDKAYAALGRKDYRNSIQFAEKAFAFNHDLNLLVSIQLAAAQMGDLGKLEEAVRKLQEVQPEKYLDLKMKIDAVEAYAMVKNNQREAARKLVRVWKDSDRAEGRVIGFWRHFPGGMDVARNWADLMQN